MVLNYLGSPFYCRVTDNSNKPTYNSSDTSRVKVDLSHLELIPADEPASFVIHVDGSTPAELGVSVRAPSQATLPVRVNGSTRIGFRAEFVPREVGVHSVMVDYNGEPVPGTPFSSKVNDMMKRFYVLI